MCRTPAHTRKESQPRLTGKDCAWWEVGLLCKGKNVARPVPCSLSRLPSLPFLTHGTGLKHLLKGLCWIAILSHKRTLKIVAGHKNRTLSLVFPSTRWKEWNITALQPICTHIPYKGRGISTEQTPIMFTVGEVKVDFSLVCSLLRDLYLHLTEIMSYLWSCQCPPPSSYITIVTMKDNHIFP